MTTLTKLDPKTVADRIKIGDAVLIDIRESDEYAKEHIANAVSLPISALDRAHLDVKAGQQAVFHCKSGMRTDTHCARLAAHVTGEAFMLDGGLDAWRASGLPTVIDANAPMEINRQVQITAGALVLAGVVLGTFVQPSFYGLSAFIGAGLMFAGISGWCGMGKLLGAMPWNRTSVAG